MAHIVINLPIKINETVKKDGYVITDSDDTQYFFYNTPDNKEILLYDGFVKKIKKHN